MSILRASLLALCFAFSSLSVQAQSSAPILPGSELLWSSLNGIALTLPTAYDSFIASLTGQINFLALNNQSLQDSNAQLAGSNKSLTLRNADLQNSLAISQAQVTTSESKSMLLQKDLDDSIAYTIQAENDARAMGLQLNIWRGVAVVVGIAAADGAVKIFTGKDAVEWLISLFRK